MASNHFDPSLGAFASPTKTHQRTFNSEPSGSVSKEKQPRVEVQLSDYSVVCGRGKDSYTHIGNLRFRILASLFIETYSRAESKIAKSVIVSEIITVIRQAGGTFCTYEMGVWFEVKGPRAREKVSGLLRDLLHTEYRSSAKAKAKRRRYQKAGKQKQKQKQPSGQKRVEGIGDSDASSMSCEGTGDSDDCSTTSWCWGRSKDSLGFEYWLEEPDNFFDMDVF
jgi:hypothetical protein